MHDEACCAPCTAFGPSRRAPARALLAHEASGYREWSASARARVNPGASGRGLSLTLAPVVGAAGSGIGELYGLKQTRGLADGREKFEAERRLKAEVGYGLLAPHRDVWTPYAGLSWTEDGGRTHRTGVRWDLAPGATSRNSSSMPFHKRFWFRACLKNGQRLRSADSRKAHRVKNSRELPPMPFPRAGSASLRL